MENRGSAKRNGALLLLIMALSAVWSGGSSQIMFQTPAGTVLEDDVTVGMATDVLIEVICNSSSSSARWSYPDGRDVDSPLTTFGVSQNPSMGILRIYPASSLPDNTQFNCTADQMTETITFRAVESLFFTQPLPSTLYPDSTFNCSLPDLPENSVTNQMTDRDGTTLRYCAVTTERGSFQSRQVPVFQQTGPLYVFQPINVTVPSNSSAAFSCSVRPDASLVNITWYFDPAPFMSNDSDREIVTDGVISDFAHMGTSVLVRSNVTDSERGFYFCVAYFMSGETVTSETGFLEINDSIAVSSLSPFLLKPPSSLTIPEATNVTLPCLARDNSITPNWGSVPNGFADDVSLTIISANSTNNDTYTCQVDSMTATVDLNVLFPLQFTATPSNETTVLINSDVTLSCSAVGNPTGTIRWLRNATELTTTGSDLLLTNVQPNDTAIYQCIVQLVQAPFTSITALTYLLVEYTFEPSILPSDALVDPLAATIVTITCTIESQPLANITWDVGNTPAMFQQLPVGFRGPSVSILTVNSSYLSGSVDFTCTGVSGNRTVTATATIDAFSEVTITQNPAVQIVLNGTRVSFSCAAMSIPRPNITWFRIESGTPTMLAQPNTTVTEGANGSITSTLTIIANTADDFGDYFCIADNTRFNATSNRAPLIQGFETEIATPPATAQPTVSGETVVFTCTASGIPRPAINWLVNPHVEFDPPASVNMSSDRVQSTLSVSITVNLTTVQCTAANMFNNVSSLTVEHLIGGPPLTAVITTPVMPEARLAVINWIEPFSLLPITSYSLNLTRLSNGNSVTFSVTTGTSITINSTHLSPFINYTVTVTAINRAGPSETDTVSFRTAEAAPDGVPVIRTSSSSAQGEIFLDWTDINMAERNGIILNYTVEYTSNTTTPINTTVAGNNVTMTDLAGGTEYSIRVLGRTSAGEGPFSDPRTQMTIFNPPPITEFEPEVPTDQSVSTTTIPFNLPQLDSNVQFIWVVVIKLNQTLSRELFPQGGTPLNPDVRYPTNESFLNVAQVNSSSVPSGYPYIAAEITVASLTFPYTFIIGSTQDVNDQPSLYVNPPLEAGTEYTFFVRAFPPAADSFSASTVKKRQSPSNPRQYTVFTSTQFSQPQLTSSESSGLSGGVIAAIVIIILILILILVVVSVIAFLLFVRPKGSVRFPPPGNRRGSVRLTESQKLLSPVLNSSQHSIASSQIAVVRDVRKSAEFAELTPSDQRKPIPIAHFPEYVKSLHANSDHLFSEEYELITIKSPSLPHEASQMQCNIEKNRYGNINSFDKTRVVLSTISGIEGSDYINANYIDGYGTTDTYIACQGPLAETTPDFWRMVYEQKSSCIVMLTNCVEKGRPKCHQYWPQSGSSTFDDLTVTIIDQQVLAYYTIRTFKLSKGDSSSEVKQFHFTAWPDFGVPDHPNPILSFVRRINNFSRTGPDIVHCSAGVGRSGTFIAIQSMLLMMESEGKVDVFNFVLDMRHKRNYMVQTEAQYMFVHDSLVEVIRVGNTEVTVQSFPKEVTTLTTKDTETDLCPLQEQFDKLNSIDIPVPSQFISATLPVNQTKNRFSDILPYESYRVRLLMLPGVMGSDYINANYVDGYLRCNQFIMTQGPLKNTVDDFWRMIWEHRVSAIVMLCQLKENGKDQSVQYWPSEELTQYGDMFIETLNETDTGFYIIREIQITHTKQGNEVRQVKQFHYTDWSEDKCPNTSGALMDMIGLVQKAHHLFGGGPVVVHDSSSIGRSGTFCILNIVIERLKVEGMVDIFFTIHSLRRKHPGIVATYDQYRFCFTTILEYLNSFDKYANFD